MPTHRTGAARPEIVFWSDFPLGYHNREAEEKMARFAGRGYPVLYVEKIGIRNPGLRHVPALLERLVGRRRQGAAFPFHSVSPKLLFPRRAPLIAGLNQRLLARQVASTIRDSAGAVFWIRYPSPEIPPLLDAVGPRLRPLLRAMERAILDRAQLVFAWSPPLRDRLAAIHSNVVLAGPAADLEQLSSGRGQRSEDRLAVFAGAIDFRCDTDLLARVAEALGDWRFSIAGPVMDRRDRRTLISLANVNLVGVLPPERIPSLVGRARVCLMPYRRNDFNETLFPVKLVEYLAAGRPVVSTRIRAAREFSDVVALADDPGEFAAAVVQSAEMDSESAGDRRAERAKPYSWEARIKQMEGALQDALEHG
jgi:glycosyltransferase involved in cell wall biosynthesis